MGAHRARRAGPPAAGALAAVVVALGAPATAAAVPTVLDPAPLSAAGAMAGAPRVAMDADGGLLALWRDGGVDRVVVVARAPGGAPGPPVALSPAGAGAPALALAPSGAAVAAWWRPGDDGTVVQAAARAPGGAFAPPVDVSPPGAFAPAVAVAPDGGAVVAWLRFDGTATVVEASLRPPGGAFGPPVPVSEPGRNAFAPQAAVDGAGRLALAWNRSDGDATRIQAALGSLTAGPGAARTLSAAREDAYDPRLALTPSGAALVAWTRSDGAHARVQLAELGPGGPSPAEDLSAAGADAQQPQLAVDAAGAAVIAWRRGPAGGGRVQARDRSPDGDLAAAQDLSPAGEDAADPRLSVDGGGRAVVAWRRDDATDPRVRLAAREPGGAWSAPEDASPRGAVVADPALAADGAGNGALAWRRVGGAGDVVEVAGLDDAPPVVLALEVPAAATAGEPVAMRVRMRDVWSPLAGEPAWSTGDGGTAQGAVVQHAFASPGGYAVRVSQADATGRVAVAGGPVVVSAIAGLAAPPPAAPPAGRPSRRPVVLRAGWSTAVRGGRAWLRVRGRTARALAGRRVIVERRAGRRVRVLCRVPIRTRGGFDGRCRIDRLARRGRVTVRVRARVAPTATTRARAVPWVTRRAAIPPARRVAAR